MYYTNEQRIKNFIETIAEFNSTPGEGCTRFSYSPQDKMVKDYIFGIFKQLALTVKVDAVGNVRARMEGKHPELPAVMIGSHIDTVRNGGNYDGVVGVAGAIEVIRVLKENCIETKHPIEIIIFAEEEGSNFGTTMVGSKAITGKYEITDLQKLKNEHGTSSLEIMKGYGLKPELIQGSLLSKNEIFAMLELHIEQGIVLDKEKLKVGIVTAVAGMKTINVTVNGVANHAGTTPMNMRKDPLAAGARMISNIETVAKYHVNPTTVATVGRIECTPNMPNVIPQKVVFTIDVRDITAEGIETAIQKISQGICNAEKEYGVTVSTEIIGESTSIHLSDWIAEIIESEVKKLSIPYKRMHSGAVHDAAMMAHITSVGMIFVPSVKGKSHAPEEHTAYDDIKSGCDVLLNSVLSIDRSNILEGSKSTN
ncbi:MAG: M20 family metallo-hydrolase [Clostridiaceae bacterium]